mgnify:CR=1 FL=1
MRRRQLSRYRDIEDRAALIRARLLAFATLVTGLAYLSWLFFALNQAHPLIAAAFYLAEAVCFLLFLVASFTVWRLRYKREEGLPIETPSASIGTTNAEMPRCPLSGSVFAKTTVQAAWPAGNAPPADVPVTSS